MFRIINQMLKTEIKQNIHLKEIIIHNTELLEVIVQ